MIHSFIPKCMTGLLVLYSVFISGCGDSGYSMDPPYVVNGVVSTGETSAGTVFLRTKTRWDIYSSEIQNDGTYEINVYKHDPPYLVWAEVNSGSKTLYSYSSGSLSTGEEPEDETIENPPEINDRIVNINPLTDMAVSMALTHNPSVHYLENPDAVHPDASSVNNNQDDIETLFGEAFKVIGHTEGFNIFHQKYDPDDDLFETLLQILSVNYISPYRVSLTETLTQTVIYDYDLSEDDVIISFDKKEFGELVKSSLGIDDTSL